MGSYTLRVSTHKKSASRPGRPGGLHNCQFGAEQSFTATGSIAAAGWQFAAIAPLHSAFSKRTATGAVGASAAWPALAVLAARARANRGLAASALRALAIRAALAIIAAGARTRPLGTTRSRLAARRTLALFTTGTCATILPALARLAGAYRLAFAICDRLLGCKSRDEE